MVGPDSIRALVQEAIDKGGDVGRGGEQGDRSDAAGDVEKIEPLSGVAGTVEDLTTKSIGAVYDTIRSVNEQVGQIAGQHLRSDRSS